MVVVLVLIAIVIIIVAVLVSKRKKTSLVGLSSCDSIFNNDYPPIKNKTPADTSGLYSIIANTILGIAQAITTSDLVKNQTFRVSDGKPDSTLNKIIYDDVIYDAAGFNFYLGSISGITDTMSLKGVYQIQEQYTDFASSSHSVYAVIPYSVSATANMRVISALIDEFTAVKLDACGQVRALLTYNCDSLGTNITGFQLFGFEILSLSYYIENVTIRTLAGIAAIFVDITESIQESLISLMNGTVLGIVNGIINRPFPIKFPNFVGCLSVPKLTSPSTTSVFNGMRDYASSSLPPADPQRYNTCISNCRPFNPVFCANFCSKYASAREINGTQQSCSNLCSADGSCQQFDWIPKSAETTDYPYDYCYTYSSHQPLDKAGSGSIAFQKVFNTYVMNGVTIGTVTGSRHANFIGSSGEGKSLKPVTLAVVDCISSPGCSVVDQRNGMGHAYINEDPGEVVRDPTASTLLLSR